MPAGRVQQQRDYAAYGIRSVSTVSAPARRNTARMDGGNSYDGANSHTINFKKGNADGDLVTAPLPKSTGRTGTTIHWKPDLEVFTEIDVPLDWYVTTLKRQSVVNAGVKFLLRYEVDEGFDEQVLAKKVVDMSEGGGENPLTGAVDWKTETRGETAPTRRI